MSDPDERRASDAAKDSRSAAKRHKAVWLDSIGDAPSVVYRLMTEQPPAATVSVFEQYVDAADWYRRCLEDVIDRRTVRGLAEAKAGYDSALDAVREAMTAARRHNRRECWCGIDHELERRIAETGSNSPVTPEEAASIRQAAQDRTTTWPDTWDGGYPL